MNHNAVYNNIIKNRVENPIDVSQYTETHHIKPRSLGGTNIPSNLVKLLPKEHFICHLLLVYMYKNTLGYYKMLKAFNMMQYAKSSTQYRYITGKRYAHLRTEFAKSMSASQKGKLNSQFGLIWIHHLAEQVNKKIKKYELAEWEENGWTKGRVVNFNKSVKMLSEDVKQERRDVRKASTVNRNLLISIEKKRLNLLLADQKKKETVIKLESWYKIYRSVTFDEFKTITGYNKSLENIVQQFKRHVNDYVSMDHTAVMQRNTE